MSIEAHCVTRLFGSQKALDGVSFRVGKGEVVGLLGPNGAGKSTMMRIITGFIPQHEGEVRVCGMDVSTRSLDVRRRLGYLPEHNPLYHDMYVREYLRFVAGLHKLGRKAGLRVEEMIAQTGLGAEAGKKIGALSRGYRQRVGLAQALIHDPEVLILDEPTSGLDPNQLVEIRQLISRMGEQKTVVLSTHIMQEVEAVCDRVVIIHKGKLVADAPTGELRLLDRAGGVVSVEFDKAPDLVALEAIPGVGGLIRDGQARFRLLCEGTADPRQEVFRFAVAQGRVILSMGLEERSLEQVFRQLTA
jgi:ABC-2 type transport system ATP-binding protein